MNKNINKLRNKINKIDNSILELLAQRAEISQTIGLEKNKKGYPICDRKRESAVIKQRQSIGVKNNLDRKFIAKLFKLIFKYSKHLQKAQK